MSITPGDPGPTDPASDDRPVPPYDDRRQSADVDTDEEKLHREGANVGGATGPVETDAELKREDPDQTERGAVASPADEQPAAESGGDEPDEGSTGPAHHPGTPRGEDMSQDDHDQGEGEKAQ